MVARYEMKDAVVNAWQWDGSVTGGQTIQAQFASQEMSFFQSMKTGSDPVLNIRDLKSFTVTPAAPRDFVILMADGSAQVMKPDAFAAQYREIEATPEPQGGNQAPSGTSTTEAGQNGSTGSP